MEILTLILTLPINRDYSQNILSLKGCWGLEPYRSAAKKGRDAFGTHMENRETFLQSHMRLHQLLILKIWIHGVQHWGAPSYVYSGEKWKTRTKSRSEMPVQTVSERFSHLQWRRLFKELWGRQTTTADFGSSFRQVPYTSNLCLLEDKVQDRGMYLFTIPHGSNAMDQRSGVGWFSGWIEIIVIDMAYFNAEFWSTWCEDCFGAEQNHP